MAAKVCKTLCLVIFFAFLIQGSEQCDTNSLILSQNMTGQMVQAKPEWEVKVTNPCGCVFFDITLSCAGFQSVTPINSSVLSKSGDRCLVNNGGRLDEESVFAFNYVWDTSFDLKIIFATIACS